MRTSIRRIPLLSDEAVFYAEQWIALAVGAVCFGTALWAGVHDYGLAGLAHRSTIREAAFFLLNWSMAIASALIGAVLLRFAFRGRSHRKTRERAPREAGRDTRRVGKGSNVTQLAGSGGGE